MLKGTSLIWLRLGYQIILKEEEANIPQDVFTVAGIVTDSLTKQWIAGASVLLVDSVSGAEKTVLRWCPTNDFGFYALPRVTSGLYSLVIRAMGYETATIPIRETAGEDVQINVNLKPRDIVLQTVTVEGHRVAMTSVEGIPRGVYLRSALTDRNQYSLDGGKIFNPTHFGGVMSTFSPEVLNDVQIASGGLPPSYGGRVGGFVDLSLRDGNRKQLSGSAGMGTLGSTLTLGGPIGGSTTFLMTARKGYPNVGMDIVQPGEEPSHQSFSELVAKLTRRLSGSGQISLSGYVGGDAYDNQVIGVSQHLDNAFSWNNSTLELRWVGIVSPSLFAFASAAYSQYGFDLTHSLQENTPGVHSPRIITSTNLPSECMQKTTTMKTTWSWLEQKSLAKECVGLSARFPLRFCRLDWTTFLRGKPASISRINGNYCLV